MAASGTGSRKSAFEPHLTGFLKVAPPTYYRDQFSDWEECNRFCARLFEDTILHEDPDTVAASCWSRSEIRAESSRPPLNTFESSGRFVTSTTYC